MFSAKKITLQQLRAMFSMVAVSTLLITGSNFATAEQLSAAPKAGAAKPHQAAKTEEKKEAAKPEVDLTNAVAVTPEELVAKPHEFLGKTVKFTANFASFSTLALDYKPAYRSSKTHLSLLVLKPGTKIPLSELKLAMMIPKEKDPDTELLAKLKEGDQLELIGKEFSTALDDPWVEVFKVKKLASAKDEKKEKEAEASTDKTKSEKPAEKAPESGKSTK